LALTQLGIVENPDKTENYLWRGNLKLSAKDKSSKVKKRMVANLLS